MNSTLKYQAVEANPALVRSRSLSLAFWIAVAGAVALTVSPGLTWFNSPVGGIVGTANPEVTYGLFGYRLPVSPELLYAAGGLSILALLVFGLQRRVTALLLSFVCGLAGGAIALADLSKLQAHVKGSESVGFGVYLAVGAALLLILGSLGAARSRGGKQPN